MESEKTTLGGCSRLGRMFTFHPPLILPIEGGKVFPRALKRNTPIFSTSNFSTDFVNMGLLQKSC